MLYNRKETEGAWLELPKFILSKMKVIDPNSIKNDSIIKLFDKYKSTHFPSFLEQLIMLSNSNDFTEGEYKYYSKKINDFEKIIGTGFEARREIDEVFSKELDININMNNLYISLFKEIIELKNMMVS